MNSFGTKLRRWRKDADLTLADISRAVGKSIVHISQIERGVKNPPAHPVLEKWLTALGKGDEIQEMSMRAVCAKRSVSISLGSSSNSVAEMAGSLAREVEAGHVDDELADRITNLLRKRVKNGK